MTKKDAKTVLTSKKWFRPSNGVLRTLLAGRNTQQLMLSVTNALFSRKEKQKKDEKRKVLTQYLSETFSSINTE